MPMGPQTFCSQARRRWFLWGLLALCVSTLSPEQAQAKGPQSFWGPGYGYGYGYNYGWGYEGWMMEPMPMVVQSGPPLLTVDQQYYDVGVTGLRRLCEAHPDLCDTPNLQQSLSHLQGRRIAGITLAWSGVAAAILGPVISTAVNCSHADLYCRPDNGVVLGTVLGGLGLSVTGLILLPGNHDVMQVVNGINRQHPEHPVGLRMSRIGPKSLGLELAGTF